MWEVRNEAAVGVDDGGRYKIRFGDLTLWCVKTPDLAVSSMFPTSSTPSAVAAQLWRIKLKFRQSSFLRDICELQSGIARFLATKRTWYGFWQLIMVALVVPVITLADIEHIWLIGAVETAPRHPIVDSLCMTCGLRLAVCIRDLVLCLG